MAVLLPGAAARSGTRVGSQVHESLAILRRYAAGPPGAGVLGSGYLTVPLRRYGDAEVDAQLSDGPVSVLVAAEGGSAGLLGLLALHLCLLGAALPPLAARARGAEGGTRARVFGAVAALSLPAWTTLLMAGGNVGWLPLTGQSTPLLSVLSGSDLLLAPLMWGLGLRWASVLEPSGGAT